MKTLVSWLVVGLVLAGAPHQVSAKTDPNKAAIARRLKQAEGELKKLQLERKQLQQKIDRHIDRAVKKQKPRPYRPSV